MVCNVVSNWVEAEILIVLQNQRLIHDIDGIIEQFLDGEGKFQLTVMVKALDRSL